jgi:hypothetical protein
MPILYFTVLYTTNSGFYVRTIKIVDGRHFVYLSVSSERKVLRVMHSAYTGNGSQFLLASVL